MAPSDLTGHTLRGMVMLRAAAAQRYATGATQQCCCRGTGILLSQPERALCSLKALLCTPTVSARLTHPPLPRCNGI